jgi:hypothetical protein
MLGITLWACMVLAPRAVKACKLGQSSAVMASGRMPSIITNTTMGGILPDYCVLRLYRVTQVIMTVVYVMIDSNMVTNHEMYTKVYR